MPKVEIVIAGPERQPMLAQLLEEYAEDFKEFHPVAMGPDGRFVYEKLPLYWSEAGRYPLLVTVDGTVAGFVFVRRRSEAGGGSEVWDMAEFFVEREARRKGVGSEAARQVWRRFPGRWEVRVMEANWSALAFWSHTIGAFAGAAASVTKEENEKVGWVVFSFQAG